MHGVVSLGSLLKSQWYSRDKIADLQNTKLRRLLRHAYENVAYYRQLFDAAGLKPEDICGTQDLAKIPLTSKKQLQSLPLDAVTSSGIDISRCVRTRTSGATGLPLEILFSQTDRSIMNTSFIRAYLAWGLKPWNRLAFFQAREEYLAKKSWYEHLGIFPRRNLSASEGEEKWIKQILDWKPHLLQGYALTMKLLADAVQKGEVDPIHIPYIVNTSGMLDDRGRETLNSVFQGKVIDIYASEEAGSVIAWECPVCSEYHINSDTLVVEFLREGRPVRPGEEGEIVITNLHNYTMPFIRYRQEDTGIFSEREPACNRGLPLMTGFLGRTGDYVILPSGNKLTPHPFHLILDDIVGIGEWRLMQEDLNHIHVEIVPMDRFDGESIKGVKAKLDSIVGGTINIQISLVEQIRRDPYQKLRSVSSKVSENESVFFKVHTTERLKLFGKAYDEIQSISLVRKTPDIQEVRDILQKSSEEELSLQEINRLINGIYSSQFQNIKEYLLDFSAGIRREIFGDAVVPMAPVEASNTCASNCMFCGWRSSNADMERSAISEYLIMEQVKYLLRKGIYYIEFVGGDDFNFVRRILPSLIQSTRNLCREMGIKVKICFCSMALTKNQYRELKEIGADSMIVWQETYDPDYYRKLIIGGPKATGIDENWNVIKNGDGYSFRMHSQERALEAGLEVALGAMIGLSDNINFEIIATIEHARYLIEKYRVTRESPLIIGMPIWNAITTRSTDIRPASKGKINPYFTYFAAVYFLSLEKGKAWVFPNCRVGIEDQIAAVAAAGVFTSTEVKVGPGGYLPAVIAERRERGEDTKELEECIISEFGLNDSDLGSLGRFLDKKEQFVHHYNSHEAYLRKMEEAGLRVIESATLQ